MLCRRDRFRKGKIGADRKYRGINCPTLVYELCFAAGSHSLYPLNLGRTMFMMKNFFRVLATCCLCLSFTLAQAFVVSFEASDFG